MTTTVIKTENLSKKFNLYHRNVDRLKEILLLQLKKYHRPFYALRDVNLEVAKGECVGIIGMNGSGKSTLLSVLAGVLTPTSGSVHIDGRVSALLELGAGFNPQFTGIENIFFHCSILGFSQEQIKNMLDGILAFADIGEFAYQPLKTYSSGMYVRLAFAVAITVDPDILIVDEALAVGDAQFQAKCMRKIRQFREAGKTLLFVSHDPGAVKSLCNRAYLLHKGQVVDVGSPMKVFDLYNSLLAHREQDVQIDDINLKDALRSKSGTGEISIEHVSMLNAKGEQIELATVEDEVTFCVDIVGVEEVENLTIGFSIRDRLGNDIFGTNTFHLGTPIRKVSPGQRLSVRFKTNLNIGPGIYNISASAHAEDTHIHGNYCWVNEALIIRVGPLAHQKFTGCCWLKTTAQVIETP